MLPQKTHCYDPYLYCTDCFLPKMILALKVKKKTIIILSFLNLCISVHFKPSIKHCLFFINRHSTLSSKYLRKSYSNVGKKAMEEMFWYLNKNHASKRGASTAHAQNRKIYKWHVPRLLIFTIEVHYWMLSAFLIRLSPALLNFINIFKEKLLEEKDKMCCWETIWYLQALTIDLLSWVFQIGILQTFR